MAARVVLADLRTILRHYRRWPSTKRRDGELWQSVVDEYRRHAGETDPARLATLRRRSRDYATMLSNVSEYNRLRELDTGAENVAGSKEAIRRAAARAGLVTPPED
mmetsp:Transcript_7995/g.32996  ORF Transcript_7995/g.32996 Transcript_7995/m.32996 type:complete len:106 (-) Transcript_7995:130-447(-)